MTIEQAAVKTLAQLNLRDELATDIVDIAIVSIIAYSAIRRTLKVNDSSKYSDWLTDLVYEVDHMNINEMVADFLSREDDL